MNHKLQTDSNEERRNEILNAILANRGYTTNYAKRAFLETPPPQSITPKKVGIDPKQMQRAISRIDKAIALKELILIYGDYDTDGICSTAILWEALYELGGNVTPFIPDREKHGYGLSNKGIAEIIENPRYGSPQGKPSLIITVDNGIVAHRGIEEAKRKDIDVIVSDHHEKTGTLPPALAIIHTTKLSGSGVSWIFAQEILRKYGSKDSPLDLVTIGTIADMVPLTDWNRAIVKHGLPALRQTQRPGLRQLFAEAAVNPEELEPFHINFMIAPRLNAMGRLEDALDSLRLLCTRNDHKAQRLAGTLSQVNRQRQHLMEQMVDQAKTLYGKEKSNRSDKVIILDHEEFHAGVIGLVAGKLVEEFYRPTIILAKGEQITKASARSIPGVNIIEMIRQSQHLLIDVGGHPMAAGFTIDTERIEEFKTTIQEVAAANLSREVLIPKLIVDSEIAQADINWELYRQLERLEPFGIGNPTPTFAMKHCLVKEARPVGRNGQHLKLFFSQSGTPVDGIAFNQGEKAASLLPGTPIDIAFTLDKNLWNGREHLEVRIKDIHR